MSIMDTDILDFIAIQGNKASLVITDHLEWLNNDDEDKKHLSLLQAKLHKYLDAYDSGEIFTIEPKAKDKRIVIEIVGQYCLNRQAIQFISQYRDYLKSDYKEIKLDFIWSDYREGD